MLPEREFVWVISQNIHKHPFHTPLAACASPLGSHNLCKALTWHGCQHSEQDGTGTEKGKSLLVPRENPGRLMLNSGRCFCAAEGPCVCCSRLLLPSLPWGPGAAQALRGTHGHPPVTLLYMQLFKGCSSVFTRGKFIPRLPCV